MAPVGPPDEFFFTIGGLFGASYQVSWQEDRLWYLQRSPGGELVREAVSPSGEQWEKFWQQADSLEIWRWQEQYTDMSVRDGVLWALDIKVKGQALNSAGQNAYPPKGRGPSMTRDFRRFLQALSRLLGGRPLH